jgi:hypothetical protein
MRRASAVRAQREAQVAVYDALLFLMVVILVSTGMFLYSAKISADGPGFTSSTYQRLADAQLTAVLGRNLEVEDIEVERSVNDTTVNMSLRDVDGIGTGPNTVGWSLRAFSILTERDQTDEGTWNLTRILDNANSVFVNTTLEGTHFAWEFVENGVLVKFHSDLGPFVTLDDLPGNRWTSTHQVYSERSAEVRYHLWLA